MWALLCDYFTGYGMGSAYELLVRVRALLRPASAAPAVALPARARPSEPRYIQAVRHQGLHALVGPGCLPDQAPATWDMEPRPAENSISATAPLMRVSCGG